MADVEIKARVAPCPALPRLNKPPLSVKLRRNELAHFRPSLAVCLRSIHHLLQRGSRSELTQKNNDNNTPSGDFDILKTNGGSLSPHSPPPPPNGRGSTCLGGVPQKELTYVRHVVTLFAPASWLEEIGPGLMIKLFSGQCKTVRAVVGLFSNIISQRQTKSQREVWVLRNAKKNERTRRKQTIKLSSIVNPDLG